MVYYTPVAAPWSISGMEDLPPLIFLHNFGGASATSGPRFTAFATNYRVLAPDLIGWGESAHPVRDYQIADYLTTLAEFIQQTCRSSGGGGVSLTAALSIRLAIQQPDLFQALFLCVQLGLTTLGRVLGADSAVISTPLLDRLIYALGAEMK